MAKSKAELHDEAVKAGKVAEGTDPEDFTAAELEGLLSGEQVAWKGSLSSSEPVVQPDGHVSLSADDIKERDGKA